MLILNPLVFNSLTAK
uniref:Uncharacterized protein n=1 Tax=Anguilla anguilla TaxID=7936 RepID=A0A0E9TKL4_ANGAN